MTFKLIKFYSLTLGIGIVSSLATAQASDVKITSFNYTGTRTSAAELCGQVNGELSALTIVDVTADPSYKAPGHYSTIASKTGQFCIVINTLTGKADANLKGESKLTPAHID